MTTYAWPAGRHFMPATHELRVVDNTQRTAESSLSGYVQTTAMPGARWGWGMDFAPHTQAQRAELEAYLLALNGRQHRVQLWDLRNPRPRGNIGLTGVTLGASAAQFATSLTLAGCYPANNMLRYPATLDNAYWTKTRATITADATTTPEGDATADKLVESTDTGAHHISRSVSYVAGLTYTLSCRVKAGERSRGIIQMGNGVVSFNGGFAACNYNLSTGTVTKGTYGLTAGIEALADGWFRVWITGTADTTGTDNAFPSFLNNGTSSSYTGDGTSGLYLSGPQLEVAGTPTAYIPNATLMAGDWLGLSNGQLLRVVADATATQSGAMTVDVRHMLRAAVSSGAAITLDKPTALFVRTEAGLAMPRMPGFVEPGMSIDLVEVFA